MQLALMIASLINFVLALFVGAYVIIRGWRTKEGRILAGLSLAAALSALAFYKSILPGNDEYSALIWIKLYLIGMVLMPVLFFHFSTNLLDIKRTRFLVVYYLLSLYYILLIAIDFFIAGLSGRKNFIFWPDPKMLFSIFLFTHYFVLIVFLLFLLVSYYYKRVALKKLQIKYLIVATVIAFAGWSSSFYLWYGLEIEPFGNLFLSLFLLIPAYIISRQRLMDIRLILSKLYAFGMLTAFVFLAYSLIFIVDITIFDAYYSLANIFVRLVFAAVFVAGFVPYLEFIQKTGDYLFFKGNNPGHIIKDVLIKLSSVINLEELLDSLAGEFNKAIGTDKVGFLVFSLGEETGIEGFKFNPSINLSFIFQPSEALKEKMEKEKKMIILGELSAEDNVISQELNFHHIKNIAPLIFKERVIGMMIINDKISGESFTQEEIDFIEIMGRQASVAIVNAMLYKQVGDLNKKLKIKFEKRETDMLETTENLQDFFKISSYRLRSNLLDIKKILKSQLGSASAGKLKKDLLKDSYAKALKSADIVNDILQASEMDSGKFSFNVEKVDVKKLLKKVHGEAKIDAKIKNIDLKLVLPSGKIPPITANQEHLEQAISCLANNAIVYTSKGSVEINAVLDDSEVLIRIMDTGIGIPPGDIDKLFNKFSRAKNAVKAYEEGSGLGLFIVKKVVESHPGASIQIEKTVLGKGTVFLLKFPVS